ncbi:MAG: bifunctional 3,4-dihydroxy-2-butanone 4-phosphate synthase/GTP cyclohydrolase II [Campylobacterales bacterium]
MGSNEAIERVLKAIETIRQGKMIIMIDDEDRENEGDLVYAAALSTPELVNFMVKEARGLVCVTVDRECAARLALNPMVDRNTSSHETAFTISVDAASATTGISAPERDTTIRLLADPLSQPSDLVRPGHIFPLIAKDGGVLVRTGHTEGATDLCRLAGLAPAGVICEIMKDDGEMARRDDLDIFAAKFDLPIVYIADLIEYRMKRESLVTKVETEVTRFMEADVEVSGWRDHRGRKHRALCFGTVGESSAVKFHTIGSDVDFLMNDRQREGLMQAVAYLKQNGGVLLFMDDAKGSEGSMKEFGVGAQILVQLGIKRLTLLATRHVSEPVALSGFGLELEKEVVLA